MRARLLASILGVAAAAQAAPARADENWDFVRLSCAPELRFFEAARINLTNIPDDSALANRNGAPRRRALASLARRRGIFDAPTLHARPFRCTVAGKRRDPRGRGPWPSFTVHVRSPGASWAALVEVNGQAVGTIDLGERHARSGVRSISVEDDGVGIWVRVCTEHVDDAGCRAGYLGAMRF